MNMDGEPQDGAGHARTPPSGEAPLPPPATSEASAAIATAGAPDPSRSPPASDGTPPKPARWHKWAIGGKIDSGVKSLQSKLSEAPKTTAPATSTQSADTPTTTAK